MKLTRPIVFSVFFHLILIGLLLLLPKPETAPSNPDTVTFEVLPPLKTEVHAGGGLRELLPVFSMSAVRPDGVAEGELSDQAWGEGNSDLLHHVASTSELQKLAEELDGAMSYPAILAKRGFAGTISAQMYFQKTGGCDWKRTKVLPGQPYLRVYIFALLKKVCGLEQIQKMTLHSSDHTDLSFNFRIIREGEQIDSPASFMTGNVLAFERRVKKSPIEINAGPLVLFAGGNPFSVAVDFAWFADQWDRSMGKKDPLDAFR